MDYFLCDNVLNYADDFGGAEASEERATEAFNYLHNILNEVGIEESMKKAIKPTTCMEYLGVEFDTNKMEM